jgi:hypothetical protein
MYQSGFEFRLLKPKSADFVTLDGNGLHDKRSGLAKLLRERNSSRRIFDQNAFWLVPLGQSDSGLA